MPEGRRVLVIDGDGRVRQVLVSTLQVAGYEVEEAGNGAVALALIERWQPDLIFLDRSMADQFGWSSSRGQVADAVRAGPGIPVVLLRAPGEPERVSDRLQFAGILPKPFDLHEMLAAVYRLAGAAAA